MAARSRAGTTIGGWLTIRYWPVDQLAELGQRLQAVAGACLRGLLAAIFSARLAALALLLGLLGARQRRLQRLQQLVLGQVGVPDVHRAHLRRTRPSPPGRPSPTRSVAARASALVKPLLRAAIVKLAAIRFTSYSNGPGSVSSKSFRSNSSRRSGEANSAEVRQVRVAAELDVQPGRRRAFEVGGHDLGRAPVEGERRDHHPPVPDRHQVGLPGGVLLLEQPDRVGAVGGRRPARVAGQRRPLARLLAPRPAFVDARMRDPLPRVAWLRPRRHRLCTSRVRLHSA